MKKTLTVLAVVVVLGAIAWYFYQSRSEPAVEPAATAELAPQPAPRVEPETPKPAPPAPEPPPAASQPEPEPEPLPSLAQSDPYVSEALGELLGEAAVLRYFTAENIAGKAVATVDALGARQLPKPILAVNGPAGEYPAVPNPDPEEVIRDEVGDPVPQYLSDPAAHARYTPYVEMLEAVPPKTFVALLRDHAPLFDDAYRQLGYADRPFEARLAEVIDELLATPEVEEPLRLMKPEAYYLFVDEDLEALGAGQKILLRMGTDNAARVRSWLQAVRAAL